MGLLQNFIGSSAFFTSFSDLMKCFIRCFVMSLLNECRHFSRCFIICWHLTNIASLFSSLSSMAIVYSTASWIFLNLSATVVGANSFTSSPAVHLHNCTNFRCSTAHHSTYYCIYHFDTSHQRKPQGYISNIPWEQVYIMIYPAAMVTSQ